MRRPGRSRRESLEPRPPLKESAALIDVSSEHQLDAVIAAVRSDQSLNDVPIFGALCFVESEWGLTDFPFNVGKAWVCFPGALRKALKKKGPLTRETMEHIARRLDLSLPPAVRT